ncbi:MAG: ATP-binding protein [Hyphomicrobiales bacterium]
MMGLKLATGVVAAVLGTFSAGLLGSAAHAFTPIGSDEVKISQPEAITNALKYSNPSGVRGTISVSCRSEDGTIAVEVSDDGVSLS